MIEVKDLKKQYKPKKGATVNALNGVSLEIEEKGLVFILGKSGSGKSTLLNLLGGLDTYDSGDILIKGKSTEEFTQANFDSYRNSMVGFVFQEYNLLDDFSVGANIALAIELQGIKATDQEVSQILKQVDLEGYGNRKTNELSGGQKQRVAIARALVKNPEIILADEPTGALDSNTGIQIFDILKQLAKNKLVIVVSHDREFAEKYGDRVIELQDGLVISDIKKISSKNVATANKLNYIENEGFVTTENYKLTSSDLEMINSYLLKHKKVNITAKDEELISDSQVFVESKDNLEIKSYNEEFNMVKSKLPLPMAFKMGVSGLAHKKIRLIFTILLSMVAFVLFGIADTLGSYKKVTAFTNSIIDNDVSNIVYSKERLELVGPDDNQWERFDYMGMNNKDLNRLEELTGLKYNPVFNTKSGDYDNENYYYEYLGDSRNIGNNYYYKASLSGLVSLTEDDIRGLGYNIYGSYPKRDNEILLPVYVYDHFVKYGYRNNDFEKDITKYEDLLGLEFSTNSNENIYTVSGIIDTKFDGKPFESLKKDDGYYDYFLETNFRDLMNSSYHNLAFVSKTHFESLVRTAENNVKINNGGLYLKYGENVTYHNRIFNVDKYNNLKYFNDKESLNKDEVVINLTTYNELSRDDYDIEFKNVVNYSNSFYEYQIVIEDKYSIELRKYANENYEIAHENGMFTNPEDDKENKINEIIYYLSNEGYTHSLYFDKTGEEIYNEILASNDFVYEKTYETMNTSYYGAYHEALFEIALEYAIRNYDESVKNGYEYDKRNNYFSNVHEYAYYLMGMYDDTYTNDNYGNIFNSGIKEFIDLNIDSFKEYSVRIEVNTHDSESKLGDVLNGSAKVIGVTYPDYSTKYTLNDGSIYLSDHEYKLVNEVLISNPYSFFIANMPKEKSKIKSLVELNYEKFDEKYYYRVKNEVTSTINIANDFVEQTAKIFLYIGLGFAVFAGLMLSNFIGTSVARKKREIGILRALGARSRDVFEIFLHESLLIAAINFIVSVIATIVTVQIINTSLRSGVGLKLTLFNFGIRQVILLLLVSVFVAIAASFFPVYKFAKKKPVDAISNK